MAKGSFKGPIRLSQCMIVRNEEANIEKALSWSRDIAFERIVVDTGSTDRTVALAEKLGAKVFDFKWINDFSAAKNFAISKATGNWIAFLDADEYFSDADAAKIPGLIRRAEEANTHVIRCPLANINDQGVPFSVKPQDRIFKNNGSLLYRGHIHEQISHKENGHKIAGFFTDEITVIHTGYKPSVYASTDKLDRNVALLREELAGRPNDAKLMVYLADSLRAKSLPETMEEAEALYKDALSNYPDLESQFRRIAYNHLFFLFFAKGKANEEYEKFVDKALAEFPDSSLYTFCRGVGLHARNEFKEAQAYFVKAEALMDAQKASDIGEAYEVLPKMYAFMAFCALKLEDKAGVIKYLVLSLKVNKNQSDILGSLISNLVAGGENNADIMALLGKLYDFTDAKELLFAAKAAKGVGALALAKALLENCRV